MLYIEATPHRQSLVRVDEQMPALAGIECSMKTSFGYKDRGRPKSPGTNSDFYLCAASCLEIFDAGLPSKKNCTPFTELAPWHRLGLKTNKMQFVFEGIFRERQQKCNLPFSLSGWRRR